MTDVIIEVSGGVVQNVSVSREDVRVTVVDWDNIAGTVREEEKVVEWTPVQNARSLTPETERLYKQLIQK